MDGLTVVRWLKGFGVALAVALAAGMMSFHPGDPTVVNLVYPTGGVKNLVGLPGALVGGSLAELFGASALWIPLLLLARAFPGKRRLALPAALLYGTAALLCTAALHGLASPEPGLGPTTPGLAGLAGSRWVLGTTGPRAGGAILSFALGFALWHLFYAPWMGMALRDLQTFAGFFLRRGWAALAGLAARFTRWAKGIRRLLPRLSGGMVPPRAAEGPAPAAGQPFHPESMPSPSGQGAVATQPPGRSSPAAGGRLRAEV